MTSRKAQERWVKPVADPEQTQEPAAHGRSGGSDEEGGPVSRQIEVAQVPEALAALRAGRPVLVLDDVDRENEGDVVLAAATLTDEWCAWTIRHTSGYLCAPLTGELAARLDLPQMVERNQDDLRTAYTVTVDARVGVTTGISAADRARTARVLADPTSTPDDLVRPGHLVPLRAREGGVLTRGGHTEAAVDLCRLAGLPPVGVIGELVHDDGRMMRTPDVVALGARENLPVLTIADLIAWRRRHDRVKRAVTTTLPTAHGRFVLHGYRDRATGAEHLALVAPGHATSPQDPPLVRIHSECLTGDALGSARCDCGPQLEAALAQVSRSGERSSTCADTKAAGWACSPSSPPMRCRTRGWTPWTPRWHSAYPSTPGTMTPRSRSCTTSAWSGSRCSPGTRRR